MWYLNLYKSAPLSIFFAAVVVITGHFLDFLKVILPYFWLVAYRRIIPMPLHGVISKRPWVVIPRQLKINLSLPSIALGCHTRQLKINLSLPCIALGCHTRVWVRIGRWRSDALLQCRCSGIGIMHRDATGLDALLPRFCANYPMNPASPPA